MSTSGGIVYILDDEPEIVKALTRLLRARRFEVLGFASVHTFLEAYRPENNGCLVLDVAMPQLDGLGFFADFLRIRSTCRDFESLTNRSIALIR